MTYITNPYDFFILIWGFHIFSEDIVKAMVDPLHKPSAQQQHVQRTILPGNMSQSSYGSLPQLLPVSVSVPVSTPEPVHASESETPKVYSGPSVHTFGFGSDHDANMLKYVIITPIYSRPYLVLMRVLCRAIADTANGVYFFVENQDSKLSPKMKAYYFNLFHSKLGKIKV